MVKNLNLENEPKVLGNKPPKDVGQLVNDLIMKSLLIVLDASTAKCSCATCITARELTPSIKDLLRAKNVKEIKEVAK